MKSQENFARLLKKLNQVQVYTIYSSLKRKFRMRIKTTIKKFQIKG